MKKKRKSMSGDAFEAEALSRVHHALCLEAGAPDDARARKRRKQRIVPDSAESEASLASLESCCSEVVPHTLGRTGSAAGRAYSIVLGNGPQSAQQPAAEVCPAGLREDKVGMQESPRTTP